MSRLLGSLLVIFLTVSTIAQNTNGYWQQKVDYKMVIDVDVENFQYKGVQELTYTNNSPDTLSHVFYHLYFNAFQPSSEMDVRSLTVASPDPRVEGVITKLAPSEIGYIKPSALSQDGIALTYEVVGTILEVVLDKPIYPNKSTVFKMDWDAQVPLHIRRSGRNNIESVALSMAQWYPKLAEYDFQGWHADPYIGREFHGVWGDYDVKISIDKKYTIGGSGYLQNPSEIGHGYTKPGQKLTLPNTDKYTWHFIAPNVHDFTWAADSNYIHDTYKGPNNVDLHFFYKNNPEIITNWKELQPKTAELMEYFNENIGQYPYKQYSVIQAGDGGMEYAMCTFITGERTFESLVGVTSHELAHTWFQFLLATNELKHAWMDEGFTSYISNEALNEVLNRQQTNPHSGSYLNYSYVAQSGYEQPQTTHSDRYSDSRFYGVSAYSKGAVFLAQLSYVIGEDNLKATLKRYFREWQFKHPTPNDFIRIAEKVSGFELDWYLMDWTQTSNTIDYAIKKVTHEDGRTVVSLERIGLMPMPIDVYVQYEDDTTELFYIPLQMTRAEKANPNLTDKFTVVKDWAWANPYYELEIINSKKVKKVTIDATKRMADINPNDNIYPLD